MPRVRNSTATPSLSTSQTLQIEELSNPYPSPRQSPRVRKYGRRNHPRAQAPHTQPNVTVNRIREDDAIVISSDEETPISSTSSNSHRAQQPNVTANRIREDDAIIISSDEETPISSTSSNSHRAQGKRRASSDNMAAFESYDQPFGSHLDTVGEANGTDKAIVSPESGKLHTLGATINKVKQSLMDATICGICTFSMNRPFTLACGHSFCAPCLRSYFRSLVNDRLKKIKYLKKHRRTYNCSEVPVSRNHLRHLRSILRLYGEHTPQEIFRLPCPGCRVPATVPPIESFAMNNLIIDIKAATETKKDEENLAADQEFQTLGYFDGLFW